LLSSLLIFILPFYSLPSFFNPATFKGCEDLLCDVSPIFILSCFDPQTVEFLNVLARTLLSDQPLVERLVAYNDWAQVHGTPEVFSGVMADILDKRNAVVIDALQRSLNRYDTIVVPWGGMHMPAIEEAVVKQGFVPGDKKERLLFAFGSISFTSLWHAMSAPAGQGGQL
jgi:hypothetical protein